VRLKVEGKRSLPGVGPRPLQWSRRAKNGGSKEMVVAVTVAVVVV
jgi:hypothetical protein